jgi:hypothetical protein
MAKYWSCVLKIIFIVLNVYFLKVYNKIYANMNIFLIIGVNTKLKISQFHPTLA